MRDRLGLPIHVLAYLLGYSADAISPAVKNTRELLRQQAITITPGPVRLRTLASFYDHAAASGITIPPAPAKATRRT
jgi:hypothetical protein